MANALRRRDLKLVDDTVSTPEGDNEFAPDQPLRPGAVEANVEGLQQWPSNSKMEYDKDRSTADTDVEEKDKSFVHVLDEVSTGKIQP